MVRMVLSVRDMIPKTWMVLPRRSSGMYQTRYFVFAHRIVTTLHYVSHHIVFYISYYNS